MDRLDELAIFAAIAEAGSLAGAARRLGRSAPAVTRALSALEERTGVRLVERTTRRLALTEAGREMAERARALLGDYDSVVHGLAEAPVRGLLRITAPREFGRRHVAPLVTEFLDLYPLTQVELVFNDRNLDLIEEGLDAAVRIGPLIDSALMIRKVGEVRRVVVASPDYLAARGTPEVPADVAEHDVIFGTARPGPREWRFGSTTIRLAPRLMINEVTGRLYAARAGRGLTRVLSYQVAEDLAEGRLVRVLRGYEPPPMPVQLVTASAAHRPPKLRAFLDHAAAVLRALPVIHEEPAHA